MKWDREYKSAFEIAECFTEKGIFFAFIVEKILFLKALRAIWVFT